jgi:Protein of unknown function (DUF3631)
MTLPPPEVCQQIFASWVLLGAPDWTEADRIRLFGLLAKHSLSINDLPQVFLSVGVAAAPSRPKDKIYERLWRLFGQLAADNDSIRTTAREKLNAFLSKHKLGWNGPNGFTAILLSYWADHNNIASTAAPQQGSATDAPTFNVLELILVLFDDYVVATPAQRMVFALWALATYFYDQFEYSPRLGLISPTSGYGKTTVFKLLVELASEVKLTKNTSAPAIYRRLEHRPRTTYLIDEAENQGLLTDRVLRAVVDGGYERGGSIDRAGEEFSIYFPCAYAIRGQVHDVPLAILSRSHIISMELGTPKKRFDRSDRAFPVAREMIAKLRATVSLDLNPEMPAPLCNSRNPRLADNCRPLISVADTFGPKFGEDARAALIELCANLPLSDSGIQMLEDIRKVSFDRISKKVLVEALREIGYWDAWRGPNDQGKSHPLTTGELSRVLRRFKIRARTIWPIPRLPDSKSYSGYYRADFEEAWPLHCPPENDTSTHTSKIIPLAKP